MENWQIREMDFEWSESSEWELEKRIVTFFFVFFIPMLLTVRYFPFDCIFTFEKTRLDMAYKYTESLGVKIGQSYYIV